MYKYKDTPTKTSRKYEQKQQQTCKKEKEDKHRSETVDALIFVLQI